VNPWCTAENACRPVSPHSRPRLRRDPESRPASEALAYEYRERGVQVTILCPGNTQSNFSKVANAKAVKGENESDSPEWVAKIGLDALLKGKITVIPGLANQQVAILPRFLPRERALKIVGETWKKRLRSRGVEV
jgi:short-subunit dehydrogenase